MKCTDCGAVVKPVVAIDIDGTLGDYHGHFLKFAAAYTGNDIGDDYDGRIPFKQWFLERMPREDDRSWHDVKLAYRQGAQKRSMPAYPYATGLCQNVRGAGAELWLTTTRPYLRLDNIDPDTRAWLDRHDIGYDGLIYDEAKYQRLAEYVEADRVVAVVEDLPEMWEAAVQQFGWTVPILVRTPYNAARTQGVECTTLQDVWHNIKVRLDTWRTIHE